MSKAVVFFADGTEECEALLVVDLLRRAKVEVIVASAMGRRELVSSHKIHLTADALAEEVDYSDVDMVVLPGGIPGTPNLAANKTVTETCAAFAKAGRKVAAICAAPSILASLGLLEGRNATAHAGSRVSWPVPSSTMKRSWWMATSPPAMGWAVPSPLHWNWCASWPVRQRRSVSGTPLRIGTEKGDTVCALLPAVCRTAWKTRRSYRRMDDRSGR